MQIRPATLEPRKIMADRLETALLAQVLKDAGPQPLSGPFGGGEGESQFSSFMNEHLATTMAEQMDFRLVRSGSV